MIKMGCTDCTPTSETEGNGIQDPEFVETEGEGVQDTQETPEGEYETSQRDPGTEA